MEILSANDARGLRLLAQEAGTEIADIRRKSAEAQWATLTWHGRVSSTFLCSFFSQAAPKTANAKFGALVFGPDKRLRYDLPDFESLTKKIPQGAQFIRLEHTNLNTTSPTTDFVLWSRVDLSDDKIPRVSVDRISVWSDFTWLGQIEDRLAKFLSKTHADQVPYYRAFEGINSLIQTLHFK